MNVNDDFSKRVILHAEDIPWEDSPMPGVQRRRLDRVVSESDRVTTIVRYAPNSKFSAHSHPGGEEFIVLDGVFEDDYGHWPEGSYIRNPPTSSHTPGSAKGCTIFVKLCQFQAEDRTFVHASRHHLAAVPERGREGVAASPLFQDKIEDVRFEQWAPDAEITIDASGGAELLVLEGGFSCDSEELRKHSWLRVPVGDSPRIKVGNAGAQVWMKRGHLQGL